MSGAGGVGFDAVAMHVVAGACLAAIAVAAVTVGVIYDNRTPPADRGKEALAICEKRWPDRQVRVGPYPGECVVKLADGWWPDTRIMHIPLEN